jgi:hypothetical protein
MKTYAVDAHFQGRMMLIVKASDPQEALTEARKAAYAAGSENGHSMGHLVVSNARPIVMPK